MCGRMSCHMCKEDYKKAATYFDKKNSEYTQPEWFKFANSNLDFKPSTNIAPTDVTPVLVAGEHYKRDVDRVMQPMMWGMIPRWHKGDSKSHGLTTNNCRLEGLLSSKLYSVPMKQRQRCVVLCEGFYEWQTTKGQSRNPYFIYAPQNNGVKVEDGSNWSTASWDKDNGWRGPKVLMMAGLFDKWTSPQGEDICSYSVITMESNVTLSWLHHRMPAILQTDDDVNDWLDYTNTADELVLKNLKPVISLSWHPVSTIVNNSRNKDIRCNKPIDLKKRSASSAFMSSWLKGNSAKTATCEESNETKKSKLV